MSTKTLKQVMQWRQLIDTLLDENQYADIVLKGGYFINVITREIYVADVALKGEHVLMVGDASKLIGPNTQVEHMEGKFIAPGFIDSHMHFESAMLTVTEFSRLSIPTGTTTLIADPHEIGNVLGVVGMKAMVDEAKTLPNRVLYTVPCLTPDVPGLETAGYDVNSKDMEELLTDSYVQGIGEIQGFANVRPVFKHAPEIITDQLASVAFAKSIGKTVEGNCPGLYGEDLAAHIISGGTHISCHETTGKEEMMEKLRYGITVFMREGSSQRNMAECIRAITEEGMDSRRAVLVSDDMVPEDLLKYGHMNDIVRRTIAQGVDPVEAIQMATINPATHFGFQHIGVLAPGKIADIAVISDLTQMTIEQVYLSGKKVAEKGKLVIDLPRYVYPDTVKNSVKRKPLKIEELYIQGSGSQARVRALEVIPDQNLTGKKECTLNVRDGIIQPCLQQDVLPIFVVERHGRTMNIGKTFAHGFKIKEGAIAESVAHDTHNIIACGTNYEDILTAINRVIAMDGGIAMIKDGKVVGDLPLRVGGLMTDELSGEEMSEKIAELHRQAKEELGCGIHVPFMHLSFVSLVTSPEWKITDMGLVEVDTYTVIPTVIS
ncbi:adenine deaminase [Aneurinibacillus migulanus]|uniref:Adenine deaminase n=1 Tax=Aneurinibacillus migulanus TaxID=47500 RepID=A0A0D1XUL2_ANEMI|nr:adenine deaminase C-terminal domain-containing protein [Aneurinibacillus migulanus]KIV57886.1 adenine deaminase [Aneurinibacillus migulanus]KON97355.1 adenine deaminase [Aneurinibacillus migulanus]MED0893967.1 adenine deaminase C-terminal domain-containing protein [Aneurinibacillus migulanus]MED1616732.1 adenine deaminase C-terminal domain-containing protein [Aneurinibacillus migulanus]SDJ00797.1 Adenine deaminase [Aneurinibacillus migulanus]